MRTDGKAQFNLNLALGAGLVVLGILFLLGQFLRIDLGHYFWPLFVIFPGVFLFGLALAARGPGGDALAIVGSIAIGTGIVLFFQNLSGLWATWAYAWALAVPTSLGLGFMLYGAIKGLPDKTKVGRHLALIGIAIFGAGAVFFELVIGLSGFGLGPLVWPILLIGAGAVWIMRTLISRKTA